MKKRQIKGNTIEFCFNLKNYPLEAVYGAAYVFIDRAYLFLDSPSPQKISVSLRGKKKLSRKQLEDLKGEFLNELLNYTIRVNLNKNNRKLREFIVSQSLFSAIKDDGKESFSYEDDPLGIAVPWEEKYGKKK
jgi:His-Xaa-Ser system protein HxsD